MKIIRFKKSNILKHKDSIAALRLQGPIVKNSRPYIGYINDNEIVSLIWKDSHNEICIITDEKYRNRGLMKNLLNDIISDVFKKRLSSINALPLNKISRSILKKAGFVKSEENDGYYEFEI